MNIVETIKEQLQSNKVILYMQKGTPQFPQCGFSGRAVQLLEACGHPFAFINILENPDIRAELPKYSNWPTFPQLYIDGELIGGSDILMELYEAGELKTMLDKAMAE